MQLEVRVVPNAKKFAISMKDGIWKVHVPAKADEGRANRELVGLLSEALGAPVAIVRGAKSRRKTLEVSGTESDVLSKLRAIAQENEV